MGLRLTLFYILFFCSCFSAAAQSFKYRQYTTHQGLPIDNVYTAAQDNNGFIWFATDFGISKFDGYSFKNYDIKNGLAGIAVIDIINAGADSLVFCTYPSTLQSINTKGKINTLHYENGFTIQALTRHNNIIYYLQRGFGKFGMYQNNKGKLIDADSLFNVKGVVVNAIISLKQDGIGFSTNKGFFVQNNAGIVVQYLPNQYINYAIQLADKSILVTSNGQFFSKKNNQPFSKLPVQINADKNILHMAQDSSGVVWLRGMASGIYSLENNTIKEHSYQLNMVNKNVNKFFINTSGDLFFCTGGMGVLLKPKSSFVNYETQDGLVNNKVRSLILNNNEVVIGTENGICVKTNTGIKTIPLPNIHNGLQYVYKLFNTSNNSIGACMARTFSFSNDNEVSTHYKKINAQGYTIHAFNSFCGQEISKNEYLTINTRQLVHIKNNKVIANTNLIHPGVKKVFCINKIENTIYVGVNNGVFKIENNKIVFIDSLAGVKTGQVVQLYLDTKKRLWVVTSHGLFLQEGSSYKNVINGNSMAKNYCTAICEDNEQNIWCATWAGIFKTDGKTVTNYSTNNGLLSKTCNAILFNKSTNELIVGTDNGLSIVNVKDLKNTIEKRPVVISTTYNDTLQIPNGSSLKSTQNSLNFYISTPYYKEIENISYEYKLDNGYWVESKTPNIYISDIGGGKHKLTVRIKENNQVTPNMAEFSFAIGKRFYNTWWFWVAIALAVQYLIFKIINHYNKKARERKLAEQQQLTEMAALKQQAFTSLMNPHFIFNALNSIQFYINKQDRQTANKYLSDFATLVRKSFDSAQKPYVLLDEELETVRLYLQLEKMRFTDKFNYTITLNELAEEEEWLLPGMVLQPFLENAILHGLSPLNENGQLNIDIKGINNTLYITITDNGIGIQKSKALRSTKKHNSKGMQLIKERIELLSKQSPQPITLHITDMYPNAQNAGTKIELVIPQEVYEAKN